MAYWGVDMVKCDHCHKPGGFDDVTLYSNFSRELNATGHPMCVPACLRACLSRDTAPPRWDEGPPLTVPLSRSGSSRSAPGATTT